MEISRRLEQTSARTHETVEGRHGNEARPGGCPYVLQFMCLGMNFNEYLTPFQLQLRNNVKDKVDCILISKIWHGMINEVRR